jgi:tetrahydromethanopterin S-methyltransferase subunit G
MSIFSLPAPIGVTLAMAGFAGAAVLVYYLIHRFLTTGVSPATADVADSVATRIGIVYGIVLGMMFSNVTVEYTGMINALEAEASALIRLHNAMERQEDDRLNEPRDKLLGYIRFVVEEQWPALREGQVAPSDGELIGRGLLDEIWNAVDDLDDPRRTELLRLMDEVENYRNLRLFDRLGSLLPLFWYIAIVGFFLNLAGLAIPKPASRGRAGLVALYGAMVGVVLYGILIMTRPYSPAAGVTPHIFEWLLEATL